MRESECTGICYGDLCDKERIRLIELQYISSDNTSPFKCCSANVDCVGRGTDTPTTATQVRCSWPNDSTNNCLGYGTGYRNSIGYPSCGQNLYCNTDNKIPGLWTCDAERWVKKP